MIKTLCVMNACRYELDQITDGGFYSRGPRRRQSINFYSESGAPSKLMRGNSNYRGSGSGYSRYDNYGGYRSNGNRGYGMNNSRGRGGGGWGGRGAGGYRGRY